MKPEDDEDDEEKKEENRMVLYTEEPGEEGAPLGPLALELRRRITARRLEAEHELERKQEAAVARQRLEAKRFVDALSEKQAIECGETSRRTVEHRRLIARAEQQFRIRDAVEKLGRDLKRSGDNDRNTRDKLLHLEERVKQLRANVRGEVRPHADAAVDKIEREAREDTNALGLREMFRTCNRCRRRILSTQFQGHEKVCLGAPQPEDSDDVFSRASALSGPGSPVTKKNKTVALSQRISAVTQRLNTFANDCEDAKVSKACPCCGIQIRTDDKRHVFECRRMDRFMAASKQAVSRDVATPPQAPREVRVGDTSATTMKILWQPPILDGGSPIYQYEIKMHAIRIIGHDGTRILKQAVALPPIQTSCFCLQAPVADDGYTVTDLQGGTEYTDISVRCRNEKGWSDWSSAAAGAATKAAVAPSIPLFLTWDEPSSTSAPLSWLPPFHDGGARIIEYTIAYTEVRYLTQSEYLAETGNNDQSRSRPAATMKKNNSKESMNTKRPNRPHEVRTDFELRTGSPLCKYLLNGLRGDCDYERLRIFAVNATQLVSTDCFRAENILTTKPPSEVDRLKNELDRAKNVQGLYIDSDFYQGIVQREDKADYIARLEDDLAVAVQIEEEGNDPEAENFKKRDELLLEEMTKARREARLALAADEEEAKTAQDAQHMAASGNTALSAQDEALMIQAIPDYKLRKRQFEHRISQLHNNIQMASDEQWQCFADRAALCRRMAATQARVLLVRSEIDRVATVKTAFVNSSVIHGADQRCPKIQLQRDLEAELERCLGSIAESKRRVQQLDKQRDQAKRNEARLRDEVLDRMAVFERVRTKCKRRAQMWQKNQQALTNACKASTITDDRTLIERCFDSWLDMASNRAQRRRLVAIALSSAAKRLTAAAWYRWNTGHHFLFGLEDEEFTALKRAAKTQGDGLLIEARSQRHDTETKAQKALAELAPLRAQLEQLAYSKKQLENWKHCHRAGFEVSETSVPGGFVHDSIQVVTADELAREQKLKNQRQQSSTRKAEYLNCNNKELNSSSRTVDSTRRLSSSLMLDPSAAQEWRREQKFAALNLEVKSRVLAGDALLREAKNDLAVNSFEIAVTLLWKAVPLSKQRHVDTMTLARVYSRLGQAHCRSQKWTSAVTALDRALALTKEIEDAVAVVAEPQGWGRPARELARATLGFELNDDAETIEASVNTKKSLELAAAAARSIAADSRLALGTALCQLAEYPAARHELQRAVAGYEALGDARREAQAQAELNECARRQHLGTEASAGENSTAARAPTTTRLCKEAKEKLDALAGRLVASSATQGRMTLLKRESARALMLRADQVALADRVDELKAKKEQEAQNSASIQVLRDKIKAQLLEAKASDKDEMSSALVHGREQVFDIEELKVRLAERYEEVGQEHEASCAKERSFEAKISNCYDDIRQRELELEVETGALMAKVVQRSIFRKVSLPPANVAHNDVTGHAPGCTPKLCAAHGREVHAFDADTGNLRTIFPGDDEGRHLGPPEGHTKTITALAFHADRVYSGGADGRVFVWDVSDQAIDEKRKELSFLITSERRGKETAETSPDKPKGLPLLRLEGHEASVTSIAVDSLKVVSGGGDAAIVIWATDTGRRLRRLHGHAAAITAMDIGPRWLLTASMDATAKVWSLPRDADPACAATEASDEKLRSRALQALSRTGSRANSVKCSTTLRVGPALGSSEKTKKSTTTDKNNLPPCAGGIVAAEVIVEPGLTAVKYGSLEVIGGTASGEVVVWWLATGDVLTRSKAHNGPVKDIQFDATRVVSVAGDGVVAVTDVSTGDTLQTLRGHDGAILAVAFDTRQILTVGADNSIRLWPWTRQNGETTENKSVNLAKKRTLLSGEAVFDYHVWKPGESLASLAKKYKVSVGDLVQWNAIKQPSRDLKPGVQLVVFKRDTSQLTEAEAAAKTKTKRAAKRGDEAYEAVKMRAMVAKRHAAVLAAIQARRHAELAAKRAAEPGAAQRHRDAFRLDPASAAARLAKATDPTSLDHDRLADHRIQQRECASVIARESLAARLAQNIHEDESYLASDNDNEDDNDVQAHVSSTFGGNDATIREARRQALSPKENKLQRQTRRRAEQLFDVFLLPAVLRDEVTEIAEDLLRNDMWRESLAGRLRTETKLPTIKISRPKSPNYSSDDCSAVSATSRNRRRRAQRASFRRKKENRKEAKLRLNEDKKRLALAQGDIDARTAVRMEVLHM